MRNLMLLCAALAAATSLGYAAGAQEGPRRTLKPGQVARVGEQVITAEQLIQRMVESERMMGRPAGVQGVLDVLTAEAMLHAEAARIEADLKPREIQSEVDRLVAEARQQFEEEARKLADQQSEAGAKPVELKWEDWLEKHTGLTEQEFLGLLRIKVRNDLTKKLVIWYWFESSATLDLGLVRCAKKETAQTVRQQAARGANFATLAAAHSDHPSARHSTPGRIAQVIEGDGTLLPAIDKAVWKLKDGEVSVAIETDEGWYVVKRERSTPPNEARFFDLRESLLKKANVNDNMLERWRNAIARSNRYTWERRVPGLDCEADE